MRLAIPALGLAIPGSGPRESPYTSPLLPAEPRDLKFNDLNSVLADVKMERW
jgi:hypothetical protein